eukprot:4926930-Pyramimonas_sp.AAC.1
MTRTTTAGRKIPATSGTSSCPRRWPERSTLLTLRSSRLMIVSIRPTEHEVTTTRRAARAK